MRMRTDEHEVARGTYLWLS